DNNIRKNFHAKISAESSTPSRKRKSENFEHVKLDKPDKDFKLRLVEYPSESEPEDDENKEEETSDEEDVIDFSATSFNQFTDSNKSEGGWMLKNGERVRGVLIRMTSKAIEQANELQSKKKKLDAVARAFLNCSMYSWFGDKWLDLKAKVLANINIRPKMFEGVIKSDIEKIEELKWGETVSKVMTVGRKINLQIIYRGKNLGKNVELSHSECARRTNPTKIINDRSKCLRTNKSVLDQFLSHNLSDEIIKNSAVIGLQLAALYGQVIGVDLLDDGLYFGFEGPTFRFSTQINDITVLKQAVEVLYFFK
ncbi:20277_t:CDS:2, partial [Dentiscutata erythropus]